MLQTTLRCTAVTRALSDSVALCRGTHPGAVSFSQLHSSSKLPGRPHQILTDRKKFVRRAGGLGTFWREGVGSAKLWGGGGGRRGQQEHGAHDAHDHEGTDAV